MMSSLLPVFIVILFWSSFSLVNFDIGGGDNVVKRFRHAFYVIAFVSAIYYLLSTRMISVRKLVLYVFLLAVAYSMLSFISFYVIGDASFNARLSPILRIESPIYISIILVAYSLPLISDFGNNGERVKALLIFLVMLFFLKFYNSRSAMLAFALGVLIIASAVREVQNEKFMISIVALLVISSVASYFWGGMLNRGGSYRVDIWVSSFQRVMDCGVLLGCGFNGESEIVTEEGLILHHSHNILVSHFVKTGLLGLLSLLALLVYVFKKGVTEMSIMLIGLTGALIALFFDGNSLVSNPDALWFIFWLPLTITYWEINERKWLL